MAASLSLTQVTSLSTQIERFPNHIPARFMRLSDPLNLIWAVLGGKLSHPAI